MESMTKATMWLYAWYLVFVVGLGTFAGMTFQTYDYYGSTGLNWTAFAVGAGIGAVLGFPVVVISWMVGRSRREQATQREQETARGELRDAKLNALLAANGIKLPTGDHDAPGDALSTESAVSVEFAEFQVETLLAQSAAPKRSPYEPPVD